VTTTADRKHLQGRGWRQTVQSFGGYLAGMIMPNIGAIIAWGLITALFIPTGWLPNKDLAKMVAPMITYLLPVLIGYTGGRMVHAQRGAVIGAIATMGVIVGTDIPMFLGAMIMGPLAAYLLKLLDVQTEKIKREGFEMLIDNFSLGILGMLTAIVGFFGVGPIVDWLAKEAGKGVDFLIAHSLLPIASVFVEPAKVLFLNNAINHGVLSPLAIQEAATKGKSILFMVETNPGPGSGHPHRVLPVRAEVDAPDRARRDDHSLPRRDPRDLLPVHPDEAEADPRGHRRWRLRPAHRPRVQRGSGGDPLAGQHLRLPRRDAQGWLLRRARRRGGGHCGVVRRRVAPARLRPRVQRPRGRGRGRGNRWRRSGSEGLITMTEISGKDIKNLTVACDAGMGSSVMLTSQMKKRLGKYGITVTHSAVADIPKDTQVVLCHKGLAERARAVAPNAVIVPFQVFMGDPAFNKLEKAIKDGGTLVG
jgi:PTS system mannitol-specific IIC component